MFDFFRKIFDFIYHGADDYNKTVKDAERGRKPLSADDV